ncbi:DUF4129 domain-containing protein [Paeniglutamicibacter cryotolerans]|uniref:Protein-glutamine gamma-glutamyltransferase-like C-terminal domain-containing protein n=1 Tax=Paeniglutamicibacter cryotolerans TaxID=670079 RepID=A0A839QX86_9MICC|nr:DUF4129 domain-containing protein [Paeniglutamicibacter cryotolerans]MBB2996601.1 hypothetical protein [Paeniglutamicibacter cryotolerans]
MIPFPFLSDPLNPDGFRPNGQEADRLLQEELMRAEYASGVPQLLRDFLEARLRELLDFLHEFDAMTSTPGKIMLLVLAMILAVLCAVFVRVRRSHRIEEPGYDLGLVPELTCAGYRARATAAAAAGNNALACLESFRAMVRLAEERTVLGTQPGRTAFEAATALMPAFPAQAQRLCAAAAFFNELRYGQHEASTADYARLRDLDAALESAIPHIAALPAPAATPAAPR